MSCARCTAVEGAVEAAVERRGRFCVSCGRTLPRSLDTPRRISLAARPYLTDDMTQPVLRLRHSVPRPLVPARDGQEVPA